MNGVLLFFFLSLSASINFTFTQGQGDELLAIPSLSDENHEDAFEHSHEEGDEHVVNKEVCSQQDLPSEAIAAYDRCTNFIPVYKVIC